MSTGEKNRPYKYGVGKSLCGYRKLMCITNFDLQIKLSVFKYFYLFKESILDIIWRIKDLQY